jgi:DNA-binding FrmR family transcriptional regulator
MAHTIREKTKLLARVRRIRGQVESIERALESEKGCAEVMHLVAAARGAMNGFMPGLPVFFVLARAREGI